MQPDIAAAGQTILVTVVPLRDLEEIVFGEGMQMEPVDGTATSKAAQTYWLGGRPSEYPGELSRNFGPGEAYEFNDIGYLLGSRLAFVVPPAVAQNYRLRLRIAAREMGEEIFKREVVETILTVV